MKSAVFLFSMVAIFLLSTTSCTTDSYVTDMESSVIQSDVSSASTNPIIIPKKD